jgi:hypothetical protein
VLAFEQAGELDGARFIERIRMVINIEALERRADLRAPDAIFVGFGLGMVTRMKIGGGLGGVQNANIPGQQAIQGLAQILDGDGIREREGGRSLPP